MSKWYNKQSDTGSISLRSAVEGEPPLRIVCEDHIFDVPAEGEQAMKDLAEGFDHYVPIEEAVRLRLISEDALEEKKETKKEEAARLKAEKEKADAGGGDK